MLAQQPDQYVSPDKRGPEWYGDNIRFIFSHYNKTNPHMTEVVPARAGFDQRVGNTVNGVHTPETPISYMLRMYKYYLGKQDNRDYYYFLQGESEDGVALPTPWIKGQKATSLVDFMLGKFMELIENIDPTLTSTSQAAYNRKTELLEKMLLKIQAPELFGDMSAYGVGFSPAGSEAQTLETTEDVERFMDTSYKDQAEKLAIRLADDYMRRNHMGEKLKRAALFTLLGGFIGIENRVENGREYADVVLPHELILDNSRDDDQHRKDTFVGRIQVMSREQVLINFPDLDPSFRDEIKRMTANDMMQTLGLQNVTGAEQWAWQQDGLPYFAVVTGYWKGFKDLRYNKTKDKYGNDHYEKMRGGKPSEYTTAMVYKATLIGNKYVVRHGEDTNVVRSMDNPGDVEFPLQVFMPNMVMGENKSVVARLHQHQDKIDYLTAKLTNMVDRAIGKVYYINEYKLGGDTAPDILDDFKRMGFHVGSGNATGEAEYTPGAERNVVETIDFTLDPGVTTYITMRREEERIMEEIVNLSKIALGQQTSYVGGKVQAGTVAQSALGTASLYQGFITFVEKVIKHAVNQYKIAVCSETKDTIPVIGSKGIEFLKLIKDFQFEDFDVHIKIRDFIDDQARERLLALAQAAMQNQVIDMIDYINIEQCRSYTELKSELLYSLKKKKREAQQQAQMMQMMQAAQQEQMMQGSSNMEQLKQEGENFRTGMKVAAKTAV